METFVVGSDSGMRGDGRASISKVPLGRDYTITKAGMPSHSSAAVLVDVPERVGLGAFHLYPKHRSSRMSMSRYMAMESTNG